MTGKKSSKKAGAHKKSPGKSPAKRAATKAAAPATNGAKRRHFIQLDVSEQLRGDVDGFLNSSGFSENKITVSDIGRVLFKSLVKGLPIEIRNVADYYAAQAALSKGE